MLLNIFYSIVGKKKLNESVLVFPFAYILVLEVNNITLLLVQKSVRSCPEGDAGKPAAVNRWLCPGHWSTADSAGLWSCLDRGSLDDHLKNLCIP